MRERRDPGGRLPYRLYYDEAEIDAIMEDEFRKAGAPTLPGMPAVDIDAFIEGHLGLVPEFVALPASVQGATEFYPDGTVLMKIAADLSERAEHEVCAEHLLRTTLAHEAAHVLLHRILFLKESAALLGGAASRRELCRDVRFVGSGYTGEWWEWQANRGMGALLLPRSHIIGVVRSWRVAHPRAATPDALEREISEAYAVSRQAVSYRLEQLRVLSDQRQQAMRF